MAMCRRCWSAGGSGKNRSKPSGVESASFGSALALPCSDGYREPIQNIPQRTAISAAVMRMRKSKRRGVGGADAEISDIWFLFGAG